MLAKTVEKSGRNWDERLPYVLFAYRASRQESTQESPFFLLYGRDPQLPTDSALDAPVERCHPDLRSYRQELVEGLSDAWEVARAQVKKAQQKEKRYYDRSGTLKNLKVGDRVFLQVPSLKKGTAYKFARQFQGPFRILQLYKNGADIRLVDRPQSSSLRVSLNRLRLCPKEWPSELEPPDNEARNSEEVETSGDAE